MSSSANGNHATPGEVFGTLSATTYVAGPSERRLRQAATLFAVVLAFLVGLHFGGQPEAEARCRAITSADTCALTLR